MLGDWWSSAFQAYITLDESQLRSAVTSMIYTIPSTTNTNTTTTTIGAGRSIKNNVGYQRLIEEWVGYWYHNTF